MDILHMFRLMGLLSLSASVEVAAVEIIMGNGIKLMYLRMVHLMHRAFMLYNITPL